MAPALSYWLILGVKKGSRLLPARWMARLAREMIFNPIKRL
jgi:hypothetical protein